MDMATLCVAVLVSEEGSDAPRFLMPERLGAAKLAEIHTVCLHSSYTAKNRQIICN
jgi:hypothetical protein